MQVATRQALGRRRQLGAESLAGAITTLICLHYLDEELLCPDGYTLRQVVDELRDRAAETDWDDEFLRFEIDALPLDAAWLAWAVDEPVEAAWCRAGVRADPRGLAAVGSAAALRGDDVPEIARLMVGLSVPDNEPTRRASSRSPSHG